MDMQVLRTLSESPMTNNRQSPGTDIADAVKSIEEGLGVPNILARILVSRGIIDVVEAEAFLHPQLDDLSDPFLLPDMEKGVDRVIRAIVERQKICIYGDYDADGITSAALMINFFKHIGQSPEVYLPKRQEGYGLNIEAINRFKLQSPELLICLDCGSSNRDEIAFAKESGIETVVIDHHELPDEIPEACALINPKRKDSRFPTRELAACGVTFFFLWALRRIMHKRGLLKNKINLKQELDLVTIGTIGDMVPLIKDNRVLVKFGIESMRRQPRVWLKTFLKKNLIPRGGNIDEFALNFIIIPRINATGRISKPEIALDFLVCNEENESEALLLDLQKANKERQDKEKSILSEIEGVVTKDNLSDKNSIVLFKKDWHLGVIGIVAQRLVEKFGKPSIIITEVNGIWKGSGRGGNGMNLLETIASLSHLLLKHGGHKYACGLSLSEENLIPFRDAFEERVKVMPREISKQFHVDTHAEFEEITNEFMELIEQLAPHGIGNPRPDLFLMPSDVSVINQRRVRIIDKNKKTWDGIIQNKGCSVPPPNTSAIIGYPFIKKERDEKFINIYIKEFVLNEDEGTL
ncbi:MAG: single-stranded-DNA-specific exonuclease RecJ [Proteobacteria bacterium]|nr:single-stranded-DNA-specific exonuclease RecJ [Pseudomonadota bacterium]